MGALKKSTKEGRVMRGPTFFCSTDNPSPLLKRWNPKRGPRENLWVVGRFVAGHVAAEKACSCHVICPHDARAILRR